MPDFPQQQFNNYHVRLRPNDSFRKRLAVWGFPDMLNYFNSTEIAFDLRLRVTNNEENRNINELIKYEWLLCTEDDRPVTRAGDPRFHFYDTEGSGKFEMLTTKPKRIEKKTSTSDYYQYQDRYWVMRFKSEAVKIGTCSKLGHYKVVMRFADKSDNWSSYMRMAEFTIVDKDKAQQIFLIALLSALVGAAIVLVGTAILRIFGLA
ncbi:MAG TPA: hypothetical protein VMW50_11735 [Dehalococcoidia bacterium]|nr:hypothetical protein [Dehalococcoidia bacterium]